MNTEIQTGTIFRFNSIHDRWKDKVPINTLMVADVLNECGETRRFRALAKDQPGCQGQLLNFWSDQPDDITIVGQLPPDQLNNATEWKEEFAIKQPMKFKDLKPGTIFQFTTKPDWWRNTIVSWKQPMVAMGNCWRYLDSPVVFSQTHDDLEVLGKLTSDLDNGKEWAAQADQLAIGTKFRFKSFPKRWGDDISQLLNDQTVFSVVEHHNFSGEGQCICREEDDLPSSYWSCGDGVLPSDDIEIMATAEQKPTPAQPAQPQPSAIKPGLIFFFNKTPDRWNGKIPKNTLMVAVNKSDGSGRESWHFRKLSNEHTTDHGELLNCKESDDDITMIGQFPPDQMDATEFKEEYLTTITLVDARPQPTVKQHRIIELKTKVEALEKALIAKTFDKPESEWRDKYNETNEVLTQAQKRIVNLMRTNNERFDELCELKTQLSNTRPSSRAVRFLKRIW